ncbi:hemerythrin domain-containing protein [Pseudotabrizicola formosa]|uniref:hemerythrin domain-containing protein n=1 Tax=Pseudotabrizicola formosa TaxID=2030009 RepID=UPI000CD26081|nr:hemerythrin domain-containing protein [Pseudotabrizicola formosa]
MTDDLAHRDHLPADLVTLLADWPRDRWSDVPGFEGLSSFWLDRHLGFRDLMSGLRLDAEHMSGGRIDPQRWQGRLLRGGEQLVQGLIGHHQVEDASYFPAMVQLEPRLARGFELLDRDHHALDGLLDGFVTAANDALQATDAREAALAFHASLAPFERQLIRHLEDEEDLIIPVILKHQMG